MIRIKKGLDIRIEGSAPKPQNIGQVATVVPSVIAIVPDDFPGFTPKVEVKEGDTLAAGAPLMHDKNHPEIKLVTPAAGRVRAVVRGDRRKVLRVEVEVTGSEPMAFTPEADFKASLLRSGLWAMMRQRPYDIVPHPDKAPRDIFVTAYDSAPLAPHLEYAVEGREAELAAGVKALQGLTQGKVHVSVPDGSPIAAIPGAEWHVISGPHPSGNVGVQIGAIAPVNKGETVWTLDIVTLCKIGQLAMTGKVDPKVLITVAGPKVSEPRYLLTLPGAPVQELVGDVPAHTRVISSSVISGENVGADGYLRFPYHQLSVISEGDDADEFMGWANPAPSKHSVKRSVLGHFFGGRSFAPDARLLGGRRAMILSGEYDRVFPMDILPEYLLKAIIARDIDRMEALGIYEVAPEDFALCEYVCTSKIEIQKLVREGLDFLRQEVE